MGGFFRNKWQDIAIGLVISAIFASSAPFWWHYLFPTQNNGAIGVIGFDGGCAPYQIFAQNRWAPYGTAVRTEPDVRSKRIGSFAGNYSIAVNGWVHASVAYATNTPPWNSDVWFHLSDGSGWVSYAGVRAVPTPQDPTGLAADGGQPAPMPANCQGTAQ